MSSRVAHNIERPTLTRRRFIAGSALAAAGVCVGVATSVRAQTPTSAGAAAPALIEDLVAANRILAMHGIVDAFGHVSVRHNRNRERFLLSRSLAPDLVTANDLIEYDLDSNAVNANGRSEYSERYIHAEIYKARPDVNAVVHNHAASLIPFGVTTVPMRPIYHMAGFISEGLPVYEIREASGMTNMLVSDAARGRALAAALADAPAVLMRGHGVAVVGPGLPFAVGRSIYLEANARIQLQATGLGGDITYLSAEESQAILEGGENRGYERPWELWKREALARD